MRDAQEMYLDRPRQQADLIYHIARMDSEERGALVLAYRILYEGENERT